jgi:hypothetical protein
LVLRRQGAVLGRPAGDCRRRATDTARRSLAERESLVGPRRLAHAGQRVLLEYVPQRNEWHRRAKIPLMGDTRSATATWALREQELLREQNRLLEDQNRLLAALPSHPREEVPSVIRGTRSGADAR